MQKILICGLIAVMTACSKPSGVIGNQNLEVIDQKTESIIFDAAKKTDQNAAEVFDLGVVGSSSIKKTFNISNTSGSNISLNFSDLQSKISATTRLMLNLATATPCPASLKTNKSCSFELTLSKVANESYDAIATNIIDVSSRGLNPEFGGMLFSGVKANDVSSEVPLVAVMRIDRLADSYIVPAGGSVTKRFYIGNIGSTNLKTPTVGVPLDGVLSLNACSSVVNIKPNGTCFFEIKYNSDAAPEKSNYNTSINFTSSDPLIITTGLKIDLAITNQPAIVPVVNANFNQVGSITDLSTANGKTRLYLNNTGSIALDTATVSIPAPYVVSGTSCPASLKVGKTCFYDLTINPAQTLNNAAVIAPITVGSSSFGIKAGDPVALNSPNPVSTCKAGFSMVNNSCVSSIVSQSCFINNGQGSQSSNDGGQNFGACTVQSCDLPVYEASQDGLSCNLLQVAILSPKEGDGIPGSFNVSGSCISSNSNSVNLNYVGGSFIGPASASCINNEFSASLISTILFGEGEFQVEQSSTIISRKVVTLLPYRTIPQNSIGYSDMASNMINDIYADGNDIYLAAVGGLSISHDGGLTWSTKTTANGLGSNELKLVRVIGSNVYVLSKAGVSISQNGGATFVHKDFFNTFNFKVLGQDVYVGTQSGLQISHDNGATWSTKTTADGLVGNQVYSIEASGQKLFVGTATGLSVSMDAGATWLTRTTVHGLGGNYTPSLYYDGTKLYAGSQGGVAVSINDGISFVNQSSFGNTLKVTGRGSSVFIIPFRDGVYISNDSGATFSRKGTASGIGSDNLTSAAINQSGKIFVGVGEAYGGLASSINGGSSFSVQKATTSVGGMISATAISGNTIFTGTQGTGFYRSTNGGLTFETIMASMFANNPGINGITIVGQDVYVATAGYGLMISHDLGNTWSNKRQSDGLASDTTNGVAAVGSNIYVATGAGISVSNDGGNTWSTKTTANGLRGNNVMDIKAEGSNVYAALYPASIGGLAISNDNGATWVTRTTTSGLNANGIYRVALNAGKIYALSLGGGLAVSSDGGQTFVPNTDVPNQNGRAIGFDGSTIYYANDSGLYVSTNSGASYSYQSPGNGLQSTSIRTIDKVGSILYLGTDQGLLIK